MTKWFIPAGVFLVWNSIMLSGQNSCDTTRINADIAMARQWLDSDRFQEGVDLAGAILNTVTSCSFDTLYREKTLLKLADIYRDANSDYAVRGMLNKGIDMSQRVVSILHLLPSQYSDKLATAYLNLAYSYGTNDMRQLGLEAALKGLQVRLAANPSDPKLVLNYEQVVRNNSALGNDSIAQIYLNEWEELHRRLGSKIGMQARITLAHNKASLLYQQGNLPAAMQILSDTLARYGETLRARGGFVAGPEFTLSEYYAQSGQFEKSFDIAEKNVKLFELRLKQQRGKLFGRSHFVWCLAQAARAAWGQYKTSGDTMWYRLAVEHCQRAEDIVYAVRDRPSNDGFRDWMGDDLDIMVNIAEIRQGLYEQTGDRIHVERAFEAIEASKTFATQQFLHETYALQWGGVPDSIFQQETRFREEINRLETNFFMIRMRPNADSLIAVNDQKLFTLRDQYSMLLAGLEKQYPEYYRLKYTHQAVSIDQLQHDILKPGQCLLDLYAREKQAFILLVRPDTIIWKAVVIDSSARQALKVLGTETVRFAENQQLPEDQYVQKLQLFASAAYRTYQLFIQPVEKQLSEEILIIPRNDLVSLPFGALLTRNETNMAKPAQWHFFEQEHVLSQTFSAGLFQFVNERSRSASASSLLAMAPFTDGKTMQDVQLPAGDLSLLTRSDFFKPLPNSGAEAVSIARMTGGQALTGGQATREAFLEKCARYRILHLATHSAADQTLGEYSFVALKSKEDPQKLDLLYARDIYGLRLSADLVVLSACETARGQFRWGEGVVGLTRAFTCAGARNIVASMWSVNDASTKALMLLFYQEIMKGEPYNKALSHAKRTFIKQNRQYAHPFYWAGFVLHGRS